MPRTPVLVSMLLLVPSAVFLFAQAQAPQEFKADSQLGELYLIGRTESTADKKFVNMSEHLLISVESAKLALRFPNRSSNIVAGENQQLLILSGSVKNPQTQDTSATASQLAVLRVFGSSAGQVYHVEAILETDSLGYLNATLKPGQSARYTMVVRVPGERPALTMALLRRYGPIRRYDFGAVASRVDSVFRGNGLNVASAAKATVGQVFDLDSLDWNVTSVRPVEKAGPYVGSEGKHLYAAEVQVTNRMLLAESWGWQYCTPELTDAAGNAIPWSRDMLDARTGQTFSRELASGETATLIYVFTSGSKVAPAALSLKMVKSKRQVEIALKPL